jgi:6,7-dimethyl-8-ribityllumazine synthase
LAEIESRLTQGDQEIRTRVAIVAGVWHEAISRGLLAGAHSALQESACDFEIFRVSNSFDIPVVTQALLETDWDAAVALGVIIRGATSHFEHLSHAVTSGLSSVALQTRKPIGFGMLMVDTVQQALDRAGLPDSKEDKGREAAEWTVSTVALLRRLRPSA